MIIPESVFTEYFSVCDDFIGSNFGVDCVLYYPEKRIKCNNCIFDSLLNKSSGKYQSGGPYPFSTGVCPYCNGNGYRSSVASDTIKLRLYYDKKSWVKMPNLFQLNIPDGLVQSIGHIGDMPKILRCTEALLNSQLATMRTTKYKLWGEPVPHGFKHSNYCVCMWERV